MIAQGFASDNSFECFEVGRGPMVEASTVVQDQGFATPRRVPVLRGVKIKDVGAEFSFGVAVGRDGTTLRRIMPVKVELDSASAEQAPQEPAVTLAPKFGDELAPARLQVRLITVLKNIAIVRPLAMRALDAEHRLEHGDIGQVRQQPLVAAFGQNSSGVEPWIGFGLLELRRVDGFELFVIEVTHESGSVDGDKNVQKEFARSLPPSPMSRRILVTVRARSSGFAGRSDCF